MRTLIGLLMGAVLLCGIGATVYDRNTQVTTAENYMLDSISLGTPQSVVRVAIETDTIKGHGTGFYIGHRQIVTAGHVAAPIGVGKRAKIEFENAAGGKFITSAVVLWIDTKRDTALLQSDTLDEMMVGQGMAPANMACDVPNDPVGTSIVSIGYPLSLGLRYAWGHVASGTMTMELDPSTYIGTDLALAEGNSGGPVFDRHGYVVGMSDAYSRHNTMSLLIPRSELCAALKDTHPAPATNADGTPTS